MGYMRNTYARMMAALLLGSLLASCVTGSGSELKAGPYKTEAQKVMKADWWAGDDFAWVRGANYVFGFAVNSIDQWQNYDGEAVDRELRLAQQVRINSVRVWMHCLPYE